MKIKLDYTVRTTRAPGEQTDTWVPMLVERVQPTGLDDIIEKCIDRGLIAGIKPTAAKTIADGVAQQMAKEFTEGHGVLFGSYFYGRPYLSGTVDANGRLSGDNSVNVRLYKGSAFKLSAADFTLTFTEGGNNPTIDFLVSEGATPRGEVVKRERVKLNGSMLYGAGDTVKVRFVDAAAEAEAVEVTEFTAVSSDLLAFRCPDGLVGGKKYVVTVERTDLNGITRISGPKPVTCNEGVFPRPTIISAHTVGDDDGQINMTGKLVVMGSNLETVTEVVLTQGEQGMPYATVPVTYNEEENCLMADIDLPEFDSREGKARVTTAGGTATYDVEYLNHG